MLVLGLLPGMRLTAYAEGKTDISTSTAGAAYEGTKDSEDFTNEAAPLLTHTHDDSGETITFLPWDDAAAEEIYISRTASNALPYTGNYYLTKDVTLENYFSIANFADLDTLEGATLNLCLNGHTIANTGAPSDTNLSVLYVHPGNTLNLYDDAGNAGKITADNTEGIGGVYNDGTFNMYGGTITGCKCEFGDGIDNGGIFNLYGGVIAQNESIGDRGYGGGVYNGKSTFNMYGGTISNNSADIGGGVFNLGNFIQHGGIITGNTATYTGGGVCSYSTFSMSGGAITGNDATGDDTYGGLGGGVHNTGSFTMSGGQIIGNRARDDGGGVWNHYYSADRPGTFTLSGGSIAGNEAENGGGMCNSLNTLTLSGGEITGNTAIYGGGMYNQENTFNLSGNSAVTGNTATYGGGIYNDENAFNLSGNPAVTGNAGGNVILYSAVIAVADALTYADPIGVSIVDEHDNPIAGTITSGWNAKMSDAVPDRFFVSENSDYTVEKEGDELILAVAVSFGTPDFIMPAALTTIEASAFEGITAMKVVEAGSVASIGANAFRDCAALEMIRLPKDCAIDATAFSGCGTVFVFAPAGGTAEAFCQRTDNACVFAAESN